MWQCHPAFVCVIFFGKIGYLWEQFIQFALIHNLVSFNHSQIKFYRFCISQSVFKHKFYLMKSRLKWNKICIFNSQHCFAHNIVLSINLFTIQSDSAQCICIWHNRDTKIVRWCFVYNKVSANGLRTEFCIQSIFFYLLGIQSHSINLRFIDHTAKLMEHRAAAVIMTSNVHRICDAVWISIEFCTGSFFSVEIHYKFFIFKCNCHMCPFTDRNGLWACKIHASGAIIRWCPKFFICTNMEPHTSSRGSADIISHDRLRFCRISIPVDPCRECPLRSICQHFSGNLYAAVCIEISCISIEALICNTDICLDSIFLSCGIICSFCVFLVKLKVTWYNRKLYRTLSCTCILCNRYILYPCCCYKECLVYRQSGNCQIYCFSVFLQLCLGNLGAIWQCVIGNVFCRLLIQHFVKHNRNMGCSVKFCRNNLRST